MSRFRRSPSQLAAVRVRELIAAGHDIVKLTTGEPDFPTPDVAKEAAARVMRENAIGYTPVNGTLEMREAVQGAVPAGTEKLNLKAFEAGWSAFEEEYGSRHAGADTDGVAMPNAAEMDFHRGRA